MLWFNFLLIGFLLAGVAPYLVRPLRSYFGLCVTAWLIAGLLFLNTDYFLTNPLSWSQHFDINMSFWLTGVSKIFLNVIFLVGGAVFLFASSYLKSSDRLGRFYLSFTFFITAMLGLVTADHFILAFVFWELTSFSSYMLIGYSHEQESARKSALQALTVTGTGGLCLLAGLIILQQLTGVSEFSKLPELPLPDSGLLTTSLILILIGGLSKSAQFPFHFWLPNAMKAPAPVSALLHSATMVKAGIYLFLKLDPLFNAHPVWTNLLLGSGSITLLLGAITAYHQTDLKKLLAYTTVATLGALTLLIGFEHPMSAQVALVLFMAHAGYKATLFMMAGILEKVTGLRDIKRISGLGRFIPIAFIASLGASLSMIGIPPSLGFLSKELLLKVGLYHPWSIVLLVIGFALMGSVAWLAGVKPFLGTRLSDSVKWVHPGFLITLGPLVLGLCSLIFSFDPGELIATQLYDSLAQDQQLPPLHLWSGFNLPLVLSMAVVVLAGLGVYLHPQVLHWANRNQDTEKPLADFIFDRLFNGVLRIAKFLTDLLQNGNLTRYLLLVFGGILVLGPWLFFEVNLGQGLVFEIASSVTLVQGVLGLIILICTGLAMTSQRRLTAIVSMGGIGYSIAAFYVLLGAPDLALTQVIVETLSVILFVFLLHEVPLLRSERQFWPNQGVALLISIGVGVVISVLTWQALLSEISPSISSYFGENSYLKANGKNIVNVILVDFRGFDTMGEITVLAIAAVTLTALLYKRKAEKGAS